MAGFLVPDHIENYDGPVSLRWMLAESIGILAAHLPYGQFRRGEHFRGEYQHFVGINFRWDEARKLERHQIRQLYIEPAMDVLAQEIRYRLPKGGTCFTLPIPKTIEQVASISAPKHGLDLRFIHAWETGFAGYDRRNEETGEIVHVPPEAPGWKSRFDICFA